MAPRRDPASAGSLRARGPRRAARRRGDDGAVTEVMGYIMVLFLSSAVLMLSLQAFLLSRNTTDELRAAAELRVVADRVAAEVLQAGTVAQEFKSAAYEARVDLPEMKHRTYYVALAGSTVWANSTDGRLQAEAGTLELQTLSDLTLSGSVYGTQRQAWVRYALKSDGTRTITLSAT